MTLGPTAASGLALPAAQPGLARTSGFAAMLSDKVARHLLALAPVNATPVAITSTLFRFFVEGRLGAPGWEGPLLLGFFLSAAASVPHWGRAAQTYGARRALLAGMVLAILGFGGAALLGQGDILALAAGLLRPALQRAGFTSGPVNPSEALALLTLLYALVPCGLKLLAIGLLARLPLAKG